MTHLGFQVFNHLHFICGFVFVWTTTCGKRVRESARVPARWAWVCSCVIEISTFRLIFHDCSPVLYHWLFITSPPVTPHQHHFYTIHLLFPFSSQISAIPNETSSPGLLIIGLLASDRLWMLSIKSPFIIWSLFGSTRCFNKQFNDDKHTNIAPFFVSTPFGKMSCSSCLWPARGDINLICVKIKTRF